MKSSINKLVLLVLSAVFAAILVRGQTYPQTDPTNPDEQYPRGRGGYAPQQPQPAAPPAYAPPPQAPPAYAGYNPYAYAPGGMYPPMMMPPMMMGMNPYMMMGGMGMMGRFDDRKRR